MLTLDSCRVLVAICIAVLASPAMACSFAPGYEVFRPGPVLRPRPSLNPAPAVVVDSIERGHRGDASLCADAGILVLRVPTDLFGYSLELVEGQFDDVVFPEGFVQPTQRGYLRFVWLDGNTDRQEPIKVVVKITTMSVTGVLSEPVLLTIEDPGRAAVR